MQSLSIQCPGDDDADAMGHAGELTCFSIFFWSGNTFLLGSSAWQFSVHSIERGASGQVHIVRYGKEKELPSGPRVAVEVVHTHGWRIGYHHHFQTEMTSQPCAMTPFPGQDPRTGTR